MRQAVTTLQPRLDSHPPGPISSCSPAHVVRFPHGSLSEEVGPKGRSSIDQIFLIIFTTEARVTVALRMGPDELIIALEALPKAGDA